MKIIHVVNKPMPPTGRNGGLPVMVDILAQAQVKMGYDVDVIAISQHRQSKELYSDRPPYSIYRAQQSAEACNIIKKSNVQVVHLHCNNNSVKQFCNINKITYVRTEHSLVPVQHRDSSFYDNVIFVSKSHANFHQHSVYIYNGIDTDAFNTKLRTPDTKNYLLFLGQVSRSKKGAADAIRIARNLKMPLLVAGGRNSRLPATWLRWPCSIIRPVGTVWGEEKLNILSNAKCLLVPSLWEEPFGLVMIEALACGVPVLAYNKGAASEIVRHGETGFLCENWEDMAARIADVPNLQPELCLKDVRHRFSSITMAKGYAVYYAKALAGEKW